MPTSPRRSAAPAEPANKRKRPKVDWAAIERDFRTGKFSDTELGTKYGIARESISRRRKADQSKDSTTWAQDLAPQVRAATNVLLMQETVAQKITEGHNKVTDVILATAELNKQIIGGHRRDLSATRDVAQSLLKELADASMAAAEQELLVAILSGEGPEPGDEARARAVVNKALSINSRISSIKALAETFTKIQDAEHKSYRLDDEATPASLKPKRIYLDFEDVEVKPQ